MQAFGARIRGQFRTILAVLAALEAGPRSVSQTLSSLRSVFSVIGSKSCSVVDDAEAVTVGEAGDEQMTGGSR